MKVYNIYKGCRINTYVIEDYVEEIKGNSKIMALIKLVGDKFPLVNNKQVFSRLHDLDCKLYEYKREQIRYFAQIWNKGLCIYHKEIKKKIKLPQREYNEICKKFKTLIGEINGC